MDEKRIKIDILKLEKLNKKVGKSLKSEFEISINNNPVIVTEVDKPPEEDPIFNGKDVWIQDLKISAEVRNSNGKQWLHAGRKSKISFSNIGYYYKCTVGGIPILFWIGAESKEDKGTYVCLYIDEEQVKDIKSQISQQQNPPGQIKICECTPVKGAYVIEVDNFSFVRKFNRKRRFLLKEKLQDFLNDIF